MRRTKQSLSNNLTGNQFKALIENAHEGIVLYDEDGQITYATPAVHKITGYNKNEVVGRPGIHFLHPDDIQAASECFLNLKNAARKSATLFQRIRHKKGHYIWAESRLTNLSHVPEISGIVSNFRDITEKKIAEEQAKKSRELLETINHNLSEGIFMGILNKQFIYANEALIKMLGYRNFRDLSAIKPEKIFVKKSEQKRVVEMLKRKLVLKGVETEFQKKNGHSFRGVLNVNLIMHEGREEYFVGTLRDVSKERETEQQLLESRNFLDNIINTVAAPVFVKDENHRWVMCNESFCKILGLNKKRIIGKSDPDFLAPEESKAFWRSDNETLRTGKPVIQEEKLTVKGHTHYLLTIKSRYVNEKNEKFIIGFITDFTHIKRAEQEIKHLHENLEGVLESSEESIFSVDKNYCYTAFNKRHQTIMKMFYNAEIAIGKNKIKCFNNHPDAKWVKAELDKALQGKNYITDHYQKFKNYSGYIQTTYNPIRGDNNEIKGVAVFVQDITHRKRYEQIINTINANLRGVMESTSDGIVAIDKNYRIILYNNSYAEGIKAVYGIELSMGADFIKLLPADVAKRVKENVKKVFAGERVAIEARHPQSLILETSFNPIYDHAGGISGAALFIRNITERKKIEEHNKQLNNELIAQNLQLASRENDLKAALRELSERNFELDQLMYKTSHDLRSPLSSIMGLINLANIDPDPSAFRHYLNKIEGRAKKLDEFIRSMLDYARVNRLDIESEEIDLKSFIKSCLSELEYMENFHKLNTTISVSPSGAKCNSDKLRLKIIFSNIISNAYKYFNPEVKSYLKIKVKCEAKKVILYFEDNGIGIKEEYLNKIFNMFYRATDRSQGSGLGMYIVKQAVEKLQGSIELQSSYGRGTSIKIILPN